MAKNVKNGEILIRIRFIAIYLYEFYLQKTYKYLKIPKITLETSESTKFSLTS